MTTLIAHIQIKPGREAQFEAMMLDMVEHTFTQERGVLRYEYFKAQQVNHYYCLLAFVDKWAFYQHQLSDYHQHHDFAAVIADLRLEYLDPVSGANPLPQTQDQPLSVNASDDQKQAQRSFPLTIARWWRHRR